MKNKNTNTVWIVAIICVTLVTALAIIWLNPYGPARLCWATLGSFKTNVGFTVKPDSHGRPIVDFGASSEASGAPTEPQLATFQACINTILGNPPKPKLIPEGSHTTLGYMRNLYLRQGTFQIDLIAPDTVSLHQLNNFRFFAYSASNEGAVIAQWCISNFKCVRCEPPDPKAASFVVVGLLPNRRVVRTQMPGTWPVPGRDMNGKLLTEAWEEVDDQGRRFWYACAED